MALDPLTALSVAGTVIQFVDFGSKLFSKARQLHKSESGALSVNKELDFATTSILTLLAKLHHPSLYGDPLVVCASEEEQALLDISTACRGIGEDLLKRLNGLKLQGARTKWNTLQQAIKATMSEKDLRAMMNQMSFFKETLETHVLIGIRRDMGVATLEVSDRFDALDRQTQTIVTGLLNNRSHLSDDIKGQTMAVALLLSRHEAVMIEEQKETRILVTDTMRWLKQLLVVDEVVPGEAERRCFERPRDEARIRAKAEALVLKHLEYSSMSDREEEIADAYHETFGWIYKNRQTGSIRWSPFRNGFNVEVTRSLLVKWAAPMSVSIARFYFWNSGMPDQRSQTGLLRSLLYNVLHAHPELIPIVLPTEWAARYSYVVESEVWHGTFYPSVWTLPNLVDALKLLVMQDTLPLRLCLFIDGLDEYDGNHEEMADLFRSLTCSPNVKLCVSSRPWLVFIDAFQGCPSLRLQDLTFDDIKRFATETLSTNTRYRRLADGEPDDAPALIGEIVAKADGVFLWVVLVVKSLLEGLRNRDGIGDLRRRLALLPLTLEALYRQMMGRIDPFYQRRASEIFQICRANWMTINELDRVPGEPLPSNGVSFEPLTVFMLSFATEDKPNAVFRRKIQPISQKAISFNCELMAARLKVWTAGLLEVQGSETAHIEVAGAFVPEPHAKIQYLHRTVRDFLDGGGEWEEIKSKTKGTDFEPYASLLSASILALKTSSGDTNGLWSKLVTLLTFAMHAGFVTGQTNTKLLEEFSRVMEFQLQPWSRKHGAHWTNYDIIHSLDTHHLHKSFLSLAVQFSLWGYVEERLKSNKELLVNSNGRPLLDFAVNPIPVNKYYPVSSKMVEVLLCNGADPEAKFCNQTPCDQALRWHISTITSPKMDTSDASDTSAEIEVERTSWFSSPHFWPGDEYNAEGYADLDLKLRGDNVEKLHRSNQPLGTRLDLQSEDLMYRSDDDKASPPESSDSYDDPQPRGSLMEDSEGQTSAPETMPGKATSALYPKESRDPTAHLMDLDAVSTTSPRDYQTRGEQASDYSCWEAIPRHHHPTRLEDVVEDDNEPDYDRSAVKEAQRARRRPPDRERIRNEICLALDPNYVADYTKRNVIS